MLKFNVKKSLISNYIILNLDPLCFVQSKFTFLFYNMTFIYRDNNLSISMSL